MAADLRPAFQAARIGRSYPRFTAPVAGFRSFPAFPLWKLGTRPVMPPKKDDEWDYLKKPAK